ncbi:MAG TPA: PmoA family protein, partial [Caulobacter sp.]|nr:PmoA family protein [Caulobacter sp.]
MRRQLPILALTGALALVSPAAALSADPATNPRVDAVLTDDAVTVTEAGKTVLVYRTKSLDPTAEPGRLNYVHPLYAPDGTVLTEDRPADHLHQRGAFWSWHQVLVNGKSIGDGWFMKGL